MKRFILLLFIVFSLQNTIAQEFEMVRHQVQLGETVRMISRKYKVEPAEIYRLNKFAVDGISQGQVLQLLVPKKEIVEEPVAENTASDNSVVAQHDEETARSTTSKTVTTTTVRKKKKTDSEPIADEVSVDAASGNLGDAGAAVTHTVARGETLSGIAQRYGVSVSEIKSQNEKVLKRGLQPGQVLAIIQPAGNGPDISGVRADQTITTTESSSQTEVKHKVQKGETLFYLAKKYNVSVDDIKAQNEPVLKKGLQIGQVLTIQTNN